MPRILIICGDLPPFPGLPGSGAGLRAYGLGMGLKALGHEVTWAVPEKAIPKGRPVPEEVREHLFERTELPGFIADRDPDVVIFQHWTLLYGLEPINTPTVIDLHGPALLETLYQNNPELNEFIVHKLHAFRQADLFTCAGALQKHYWYPWLTMAEHDVRRDILRVVPLSLSPDMPGRKPSEEVTLVYGGFFLPWQDPVWALERVVDELERRGTGKLKFFGGRHPMLSKMEAGVYDELEARLRNSSRVRIMGVVTRDELLEEYSRATAAVDLMARNPERELAFNSRTVEYLWAGLPVIHQPWSELAGYIREHRAGWLVELGDEAGLAAALAEIFEEPERVRKRSEQAQALVRDELGWAKTAAPLDEFIRNPSFNRTADPKLSLRIRRRPLTRIGLDLVQTTLRQGPGALVRELAKRRAAPKT